MGLSQWVIRNEDINVLVSYLREKVLLGHKLVLLEIELVLGEGPPLVRLKFGFIGGLFLGGGSMELFSGVSGAGLDPAGREKDVSRSAFFLRFCEHF